MPGIIDENSPDMASKYFQTLQAHLQVADIDNALKALRSLVGVAQTRQGINRPMVQLFAAKAMLEFHEKVARLELEGNKVGLRNEINIYSVKEQDEDDAISLSRDINRQLSFNFKR
ncbi:MAG: hypothetical protein ACOYWZ_05845 [Bacillota bacterium]